jgi:hypothetical protein
MSGGKKRKGTGMLQFNGHSFSEKGRISYFFGQSSGGEIYFANDQETARLQGCEHIPLKWKVNATGVYEYTESGLVKVHPPQDLVWWVEYCARQEMQAKIDILLASAVGDELHPTAKGDPEAEAVWAEILRRKAEELDEKCREAESWLSGIRGWVSPDGGWYDSWGIIPFYRQSQAGKLKIQSLYDWYVEGWRTGSGWRES